MILDADRMLIEFIHKNRH